jgi:hypothetical protein
MSGLRRPFLYHRHIFVTVKLVPSRAWLEAPDYERLTASLARLRRKHRFAITAWVFLPGRAAGSKIQVQNVISMSFRGQKALRDRPSRAGLRLLSRPRSRS